MAARGYDVRMLFTGPPRVCAVDGTVVASRAICAEHVQIEFLAPGLPPSEPGQFLELRCGREVDLHDVALEWREGEFPRIDADLWTGTQPFLRRPFSIADRWTDADGRTIVAVISRAVGVGTRWLEGLKPGDALNFSGPLGRGFAIPEIERPLVLVGGGVGIPPLMYLARRLGELERHDATVVLGATTRALLPVVLTAEPDRGGAPRACVSLPGGAPFETIITTDDGTAGLRGRVTDAIERWSPRGGGRPMVFACGPEAMLRAVAEQTRRREWDCQLCIEKLMGCGLGTCLSCVVRVRDADRPGGWRWALSCSEGPCFDRDVLMDDSPAQRS